MKTLKFYLTNRFILFILGNALFVGLSFLYTGKLLPETTTEQTWFYSGLFLMFFSILFIEPYYTSPKNVISNCVPLLLVYLSIRDSFRDETVWWISFGIIASLIAISIVAISINNPDKSSSSFGNIIGEKLKVIAVFFGQGKVIYTFVFLSILILYKIEIVKGTSESYFFILIMLWGLILIINPSAIHNRFAREILDNNNDAFGEIFSVQSNKMFLVKLYDDKTSIAKFDLVKFKYAMDGSSTNITQGFIFDTYNLNRQKWAKVIALSEVEDKFAKLKKNVAYKVSSAERTTLAAQLRVSSFVGVIVEGTKIGAIRFEYSKLMNTLQEGDLLELKIGDKRIFYQVLGGITNFEKLESKDESGFVIGEAMQLGVWNNEGLSFEKFGWLPEMNTPVFTANTDEIQVPEFALPEFQLGTIPNTKLPSVINLDEAISHHIALLGITGAGKSFLAKEMIDKLKTSMKVICIDFTGEWKKKMTLLPLNNANLDTFLGATTDDVGLVELPVVSNTVAVIQSTENFISLIFSKAKAAYEAGTPFKICLVLEEAHTIIPESTFLGVNDFDSKAVVNRMGQVALQGRKYGVGLMVIAQRTANVSKTVLTQCNTIICFQAFDETSFTFLGNYIGKDLVQTLPNLKRYHAIVTGKAIKSKIPMIVNLEKTI